MGKNVVHYGMLATEGLQYFFGGDVLSCLCPLGIVDQMQFSEKNLTDLLGTCDVECFTGLFVDACLIEVKPFVEDTGGLF